MIVLASAASSGLEIFPRVDAGRFQLRMRAPDRDADREDRAARHRRARRRSTRRSGEDGVEISVGYVGADPVELPDQRHLPVDRRARGGGPPGRPEGGRGRRRRGAQGAAPRARSPQQMPDVRFSFEPADIVSEVMSFGSPTPVEVAVSGPNLAENRAYAEKVRARAGRGSRRSATSSSASRSTTRPSSVEIDRERAGLSGVTVAGGRPLAGRGHLVEPVRRAELLARPQDRHRLPGAGRDPLPGHELGRARSRRSRSSGRAAPPLLLRDVADGQPGHDARRVRPLQHEAVGQPDGQHRRRGPGPGRRPASTGRSSAAGTPPKGATVDVRGQIAPMSEMLRGLAIGLGDVDRRHPAAADGQLPVGPAGAGRRLDRARRCVAGVVARPAG